MKEFYREFCQQESSIPIFSQAWWLDATAGDSWDVVLVVKGGEVQASMPYVIKKKLGFTILSQPVLTPGLGPWLRPTNATYARRLSREKELMQHLIDQLPAYGRFRQTWHPGHRNWLPFYWRGFEQTTRYTYRIQQLKDLDEIWSAFQGKIRTEIKKASNRMEITIHQDVSFGEFMDLNELVFQRQGVSLPYKRDLVERLDRAAAERGQRKLFIAKDAEGRGHAGIYLVWDGEAAYYLMGGGDPELRNSGATSLCIWSAIQFASSVTKSFDFEGSMIEPVEQFFRGFGAHQVPYFSVSHTPSALLRSASLIRDIFG